MYYSVIKEFDIANGPGCRTTLFVSGCRNHCEGCFQPETWYFTYGEEYTQETERFILDSLEPDYVAGLTLLGGDPFEEENQEALAPLLENVRQRYGSKKDIWAYTGYVYDTDLVPGGKKYTPAAERMLACLDVLVDGPFVQAQKNISLQFRGSSNQRVLDMPRTLAEGAPVWAEAFR
ncbi:MAG: anaerobic ribonucleoside-triphosphate reductase activating protein [Lachnospiraceae bacterium]|nr:anaerobic ribonucleoside-triphosphate reductase activating protein [Lachnospiraceae bacterium]